MDTVTIPKTLQKKQRRIDEETGQRPEQLVTAAVEEKLRYEKWLLGRIQAGLSDLKAGRVLSTKGLVERLTLKGVTGVRAPGCRSGT